MKSKELYGWLLSALFVAATQSCVVEITDYSDRPDNTPPGPVRDVTYIPSQGGATFYYTLPDDEDLMGVQAVFTNENGQELVMRSSAYVDSLTITGIGTTDAREVKLYAVDNSNNVSEPVALTITPGQSDIHDIAESVIVEPYSGGVRLRWSNPNRTDIAVILLCMDAATEEYIAYGTFYSDEERGTVAEYLGLEPERSYFGVYVKNRWGNTTPVKYYTVTPDPYALNPYLANKTTFRVPQFLKNPEYAQMEQVTYEAWVKMYSHPEEWPYISTVMGIEAGNSLFIRIVEGVVEVPYFSNLRPANDPVLDLDRWYHIAVTYNGSMGRLYIDGREVSSRSKTDPGYIDMSTYSPNDEAFMIGQSWGGRRLDGEICDVRIWNVARTRTEINDNMCGVDPSTPGLVANWRFDEGRGTAIKDYSPNEYHIETDVRFDWIPGPAACESEYE